MCTLLTSFARRRDISADSRIYLTHSLNTLKGDSVFYLTAKEQKPKLCFRPVVSTSGTAIACFSKWVDKQLQLLKKYIDTYLNNSDQLLRKLLEVQSKMKRFDVNVYLFSYDAKSMYTNIYTQHAINSILSLLTNEFTSLLSFVILSCFSCWFLAYDTS